MSSPTWTPEALADTARMTPARLESLMLSNAEAADGHARNAEFALSILLRGVRGPSPSLNAAWAHMKRARDAADAALAAIEKATGLDSTGPRLGEAWSPAAGVRSVCNFPGCDCEGETPVCEDNPHHKKAPEVKDGR